jgi:hypothetical protein
MSSGHSEDSGAGVGFETKRGRDFPTVRQFNVFVENRVGGLLNVVRRFETTDNHIVSLTVVDSADCAIIRLVMSDPERAYEIIQQSKMAFTQSDLLVVELPDGPQPLLQICKALLSAEVNIHYAYPLLVGPGGRAALALRVEEFETSANTLSAQGFTLLSEGDLTQ